LFKHSDIVSHSDFLLCKHNCITVSLLEIFGRGWLC